MPASLLALSTRYCLTPHPSCRAMFAFFWRPLNGHHLKPSGVTHAAAALLPPHASAQAGGARFLPRLGCIGTVQFTSGNRSSMTRICLRACRGSQQLLSLCMCRMTFLNACEPCTKPRMNSGNTVMQNSQHPSKWLISVKLACFVVR